MKNFKKYLTFTIICCIFASCTVQQSPLKERDAQKRQKEIQKNLRSQYGRRN